MGKKKVEDTVVSRGLYADPLGGVQVNLQTGEQGTGARQPLDRIICQPTNTSHAPQKYATRACLQAVLVREGGPRMSRFDQLYERTLDAQHRSGGVRRLGLDTI